MMIRKTILHYQMENSLISTQNRRQFIGTLDKNVRWEEVVEAAGSCKIPKQVVR